MLEALRAGASESRRRNERDRSRRSEFLNAARRWILGASISVASLMNQGITFVHQLGESGEASGKGIVATAGAITGGTVLVGAQRSCSRFIGRVVEMPTTESALAAGEGELEPVMASKLNRSDGPGSSSAKEVDLASTRLVRYGEESMMIEREAIAVRSSLDAAVLKLNRTRAAIRDSIADDTARSTVPVLYGPDGRVLSTADRLPGDFRGLYEARASEILRDAMKDIPIEDLPNEKVLAAELRSALSSSGRKLKYEYSFSANTGKLELLLKGKHGTCKAEVNIYRCVTRVAALAATEEIGRRFVVRSGVSFFERNALAVRPG